jgi:hypothetical protein
MSIRSMLARVRAMTPAAPEPARDSRPGIRIPGVEPGLRPAIYDRDAPGIVVPTVDERWSRRDGGLDGEGEGGAGDGGRDA